jgi:sodium pump decarboxylase gamma subunit
MENISTGSVIGIGLGTVFICLVCLVLICYLTSAIAKLFKKDEKQTDAPPKTQPQAIPNKGELVAAIAAAIAEDLGTEVSGIRIKSIKRI